MSSDHDFSTLFELLPIGAYRTDAQSRQVRANRAMVKIFGFESEAQMLATVKSSGGGWYAQPQRREEFKAQLLAHGSLRDFVSEMRRNNGETFWISENAHSVYDEAGQLRYHEGTVEDITARVQADLAAAAASALLQERTHSLQVTLDNAGRGIGLADAQGRVVLYNQRLLELLDLTPAILENQPLMRDVVRFQHQRGDFDGEHMARDDLQDLQQRIQLDMQGSFSPGTYLRRNRSGRVLEIATAILADGSVIRTYSDVTAYFNTQKELAEKSRKLQITLDTMSQGLATIDTGEHITLSNRRYREMLNFSDELMATQPSLDTLAQLQLQRGDFGSNAELITPEVRDAIALGDKLPALQGPTTYLRKTADGRVLEVMTRALPEGGAVRTFSDVTSYLQVQEALQEKQSQLSALINTLPDWVWLKDAQGVYLLCNPAYCHQHGLQEADMLGKTAHQLFGPVAGDIFWAEDVRAMASVQPIVFETEFSNQTTGEYCHYELIKVAMRDSAGQGVGMLGIGRNITARKRSEAALIAAKDAAQAGEKAKSEFLANMSHEIRTPMNAVIGMSDLLLDSPLTPEQKEFAETIRTSGDALLGLINNILDFSKIESGHLELERLPVNLGECVESALDITSGPALAKGLDLLYWLDDEVPRMVFGDITRLRQVFINLINNAIKFTQQGEVLVSLSCKRVEATGQLRLHCSVHDSGIGIPADRLNRLFQVFSQVDASTTRQYGGSGLGLAICRRLVELMGGRIWVESTPGEGSNFQFDIPCEAVPSSPSAYLGRQTANLQGLRLLVVDDNTTNCRILTLQTTRWGMQPRAAASGEQALAWLNAGEMFDAAVLDVQMPVMDGYALLAQIRKRFTPTQLPVLVLTSSGPGFDKGAGLGVAQTLTKPVKAAALHDALQRLFDRREANREANREVLDAGVGIGMATGPAAPTKPRLAQELPLRLILAEDNLVNQRVASLILSGLGYALRVVSDGQEALDAVAQSIDESQAFDVVLMDVQMPVLDGLVASRMLCTQYPKLARPWIVAMTANALEGDRETCLAAGMDDYISKPVRAVALVETLRRAAAGLAQRRAESAANKTL
jgi:PAS domain S-box-containing protein